MYEDFDFPFENLIEDEKIAIEIEKTLREAVKRCLEKNKKCALFFSGGLDSSVIAKLLNETDVEFTAYTAGTKGSQDPVIAKHVAVELGIKIKTITIKQEEIPDLVKAVTWITKSDDPVTIGVGIPLYVAAREASQDGYKIIFSGSGSDELFAGYDSHAKAFIKGLKDVHEECVKRVHGINKDIARDASICKHFSLDSFMPFMDIDLVRLTMNIHPKLKISGEENKIILRKIARDIGLPKEAYERKKKAAQYGSGVSKTIKAVSKKYGYDNVREYLKEQLANVYKTK